jgi:uncharacterized membrane protein
MSSSLLNKGRIGLVVVALILLGGIVYLSLPDRRTRVERLSDAADQPKDHSVIEKTADKVDEIIDENRSREETRQSTARP